MSEKKDKLKFKDRHKRFIVALLASFLSPTEVIEALREEFKDDFQGATLTRQSIEFYDPTKVAGRKLSEELKALFNASREEYLSGVENIGIAHKVYRLERLHRMAERLERAGAPMKAAQIYEQAAREMGGAYTNKREHTGKGGGELLQKIIVEVLDGKRADDSDE